VKNIQWENYIILTEPPLITSPIDFHRV